MIKQLKTMAEKLPYPIGRVLSWYPFSLRLGPRYSKFHRLAQASLKWSGEEREAYVLPRLRGIVEFARSKFPCYRELYRKHGVLDLAVESFDDFRRLPVTDKAFFREHAEEFSGAYRLNTGGTTGTPFFFYVDKLAWAREWAHMHLIWEMRGYDHMALNLALRGKNLGADNIRYNPVHNEFLINTYKPVASFLSELEKLFRTRKIRYMHGYPSAIYNFIVELEKCCPHEKIAEFLSPIRGVLLQSEFPFPYMKDKFNEWKLPCISWYGHSEMSILAYDDGFDNTYRPLATYGYAEVDEGRLLGTSFHNFDMPLIRYDTGDLVTELERTSHGVCTAFAVAAGRNGDFVTDRAGKEIPLTSLIFGRHHKAFEVAEHIQVHQERPGEAVIYLVKSGDVIPEPERLFDLSALDMTIRVEQRQEPILTASRKLRLKV